MPLFSSSSCGIDPLRLFSAYDTAYGHSFPLWPAALLAYLTVGFSSTLLEGLCQLFVCFPALNTQLVELGLA